MDHLDDVYYIGSEKDRSAKTESFEDVCDALLKGLFVETSVRFEPSWSNDFRRWYLYLKMVESCVQISFSDRDEVIALPLSEVITFNDLKDLLSDLFEERHDLENASVEEWFKEWLEEKTRDNEEMIEYLSEPSFISNLISSIRAVTEKVYDHADPEELARDNARLQGNARMLFKYTPNSQGLSEVEEALASLLLAIKATGL